MSLEVLTAISYYAASTAVYWAMKSLRNAISERDGKQVVDIELAKQSLAATVDAEIALNKKITKNRTKRRKSSKFAKKQANWSKKRVAMLREAETVSIKLLDEIAAQTGDGPADANWEEAVRTLRIALSEREDAAPDLDDRQKENIIKSIFEAQYYAPAESTPAVGGRESSTDPGGTSCSARG